jgi:Domain of unknown function (DUF202)
VNAPAPPAPAGTAVERTALAWARSGLATVAIAGSLLKAGLAAGHPALAITAAIALLALGAVVWTVGGRGYARRIGLSDDPQARRRVLLLASGASVLSAAIATVIVLTS